MFRISPAFWPDVYLWFAAMSLVLITSPSEKQGSFEESVYVCLFLFPRQTKSSLVFFLDIAEIAR
jgi:hypothetical protein